MKTTDNSAQYYNMARHERIVRIVSTLFFVIFVTSLSGCFGNDPEWTVAVSSTSSYTDLDNWTLSITADGDVTDHEGEGDKQFGVSGREISAKGAGDNLCVEIYKGPPPQYWSEVASDCVTSSSEPAEVSVSEPFIDWDEIRFLFCCCIPVFGILLALWEGALSNIAGIWK